MNQDPVRYQIGDFVKTRKEHPCGSIYWEITRTGMDFGLKCCYCGRHVMVPRRVFERAVRAIVTPEEVAAQKEELDRKARNRPKHLQRKPVRQPASSSATTTRRQPDAPSFRQPTPAGKPTGARRTTGSGRTGARSAPPAWRQAPGGPTPKVGGAPMAGAAAPKVDGPDPKTSG